MSEENKRKLETCQNAALRIIFGCHKETKNQTSNLELLEKAGLQKQ